MPLLDLVQVVMDEGGSVEHVSADTVLKDGDKVEIVRPMGGG